MGVVQARAASKATVPPLALKDGPAAAIRSVAAGFRLDSEKVEAVEKMRVEALLGSARRSLPRWVPWLLSLRSRRCGALCRIVSGLRAWVLFADHMLGARGRHLPPSSEGLVAFSAFFRNAGTYANYVGAVSFACQVANVPDSACRGPMIRRARMAIMKRQGPPPVRRHIQRPLLKRLMLLAMEEDD